ncbi:MAG: hydroxymyristoyl-ACP dehydratase [Pseudomonadota bacterium]
MKLGRTEIAALIPHSGRMCLLDTVLEWDTRRVVCIADPNRNPPNPLASAGQLSPLCLIEYAAQATAIHAGLNAQGAPKRQRRLAGVNAVTFENLTAWATAGRMEIQAERLAGTGEGARYAFQIHASGGLIAQGQLTVSG